MNTSIQFLVLLVVVPLNISYGLYIRNNKAAPAKADASADSRNDEWGVFQNRLGLSQEKVELLKSQKDQLGTKQLLHRFILENPKYLSAKTTNSRKKSKSSKLAFNRLFRALAKNMKSAKSTFKTSLQFEMSDRPTKPLKRTRRKISVKMMTDLSTERVDQLLKMFYQKHNIEEPNFDSDAADQHTDTDNGDYSDIASDISPHTSMDRESDSDYEYDLFDDEGNADLIAKSHQNSEYGSFQDLILQAKRKQWELESEENKLHSPPDNDHFI
ncbi:uncharacterized protein LOC6572106 [Drosophila mojavensis]|uniref:uncharacterized protein LOC6572106 n=1 Tax=Drosophila mojavensis TaxID=7230 RepID=UPI00017C7AEE|nr:uncharacterized protein LOC6572106 [Drosophila mojavensis]